LRFLFGTRLPTRPSRFLEDLPSQRYIDVSDAPIAAGAGGPAAPAGPSSTARRRSTPTRRSTTAAATVVDSNGQGWRPGDRVKHGTFGTGVILACQGSGPRLKLVVFFDRAGRKTLVPTIAKLVRL